MRSSRPDRIVIAVLITCHNRRNTTLACLRALVNEASQAVELQLFLVDDGSSDGTSEAVREFWQNAVILKGNGSLYWNRGMRLAWSHAIATNPDFYLWLNDDMEIRRGCVAELLQCYRSHGEKTLVVGKAIDLQTGVTTYGGQVRSQGRLRFKHRFLKEDEQACDTMNGNCVLIPSRAALEVGINDAGFSHAYGDLDYGFRAKSAGYSIIELKSPVAKLARNSSYERQLKLSTWRHILFHPKGDPVAEWLRFCIRHAGVLWPIHFVLLYKNMLKSSLD